MKYTATVALALLLGMSATAAWAQIGGMPGGGMPNMTPEQAQQMLDQMMKGMGTQLDLDPETLRSASPEEREEMIRGAADAMAGQATKQMEDQFGMPLDEFKKLSEDEKNALMMSLLQPQQIVEPAAPLPLLPAPVRGFPDGSAPLPVTENYDAYLVVTEQVDRELLLVVADIARREIVWRATRIAPFEEHLNLLDFTPNPSDLILELIDPNTHRVIRRYRPVAAAE